MSANIQQAIAKLNRRIANKWQEKSHQNALFERYPSFLETPISEETILYVGLNPAYQGDTNLEYDGSEISATEILRIIQNDTVSRIPGDPNYYAKFYKPIHDFHQKLVFDEGLAHAHSDLFPFRETNSKNSIISELIYSDNKPSDFTLWCLQILKEYIFVLGPKLVVVNNAMSSKIIQNYFFGNQTDMPNDGIYRHQKEGIEISFFFSGTWQYGRLDTFTEKIFLSVVRNYLQKLQ